MYLRRAAPLLRQLLSTNAAAAAADLNAVGMKAATMGAYGQSVARAAPAAVLPHRERPVSTPLAIRSICSSSSGGGGVGRLGGGPFHSALISAATQWGRSTRAQQYRLSFTTQASPDTGAVPDVIEEVDWNPELCNTVYLLGRTGQDFELKYLENGSILGRVSIAIKQPNGDSMWVNLEVWGPLAETAAATVQKGQQIAVQGRLKIRNWVTQSREKRTSTSVSVNQMKLVRQSTELEYGQGKQRGAQHYASAGAQFPASTGASNRKGSNPQADAKWTAFFQNPDVYYDNREMKKTGERSPKYPDFKSKDGNSSLWLNSYDTPRWVKGAVLDLDKQREGLDSLSDLSSF